MPKEIKRFMVDFAVSGSAAIISKTIIAPVERAKFIIQNQDFALNVLTGKQKPYTGIIDLFSRIPREQGIFSLWRGNGTNLARYFPSQALNFSLYQYNKQFFTSCLHTNDRSKQLVCKLGAGFFAGACSAAIVFPLDFCQTRLALDMGHGDGSYKHRPREFNGLFSCFYRIVGKDGIKGLYSGVHVSVVGFGIYRAFYFALYDLTKIIYLERKHGKNKSYQYTEDHQYKLPLVLSLVAAQACTVLAGMISYPLDTMARHMMLDSGRPEHLRKNTTVIITGKRIWRNHGVYGFYRGALVNVMRCTAGALVLVMYDEFVYYTYKWQIDKK